MKDDSTITDKPLYLKDSSIQNQLTSNSYLKLYQIIGSAKRGIPALIPVSRSTWLKNVKDGRYPSPVNLGARSVAWRSSDILALMEKLGSGLPKPSAPTKA